MYPKMQKALAVLLLTPMVILIITAVFSMLVDDGVIMQAWVSLLSLIPFGGFFGELAVNLFSDSFGMGMDMSKYLVMMQPMGILNILEDCCRIILTALFFEAVDCACQSFLGVFGKKSGIHNILMQMCSGMLSLLFCTFVATAVTSYLYKQLALVSGVVQGIISGVVSVISILGAYGIVAVVFGGSVLKTIAYVGVKMVLVNVLKVIASYEAMMLLLIFLNEEAYLKALGVLSGWGVVIVMLVGVDLLVSTIFD